MFLAPNCPQHDGSTSPIETKAHGFLCGTWQMKSPWEELEGTWPPQIGFPPPNWWVWLASCANTFRDKSATFLPLPKGMHKMLQTAVTTCMTDPMFGCGRSDRLIKRLRMFIHVYPCLSMFIQWSMDAHGTFNWTSQCRTSSRGCCPGPCCIPDWPVTYTLPHPSRSPFMVCHGRLIIAHHSSIHNWIPSWRIP